MNIEKAQQGISEANRNLIVFLFTAILVLWGPVDSYGIIVRIAYLIILPSLLWLGLKNFGKNWKVDSGTNDRLNRAIVALVAGAFFIGAYQSFTASYHTVCTQEVRTYDGTECVSDYESVKGGNKSGAIILSGLGIASLWYAVSKRDD